MRGIDEGRELKVPAGSGQKVRAGGKERLLLAALSVLLPLITLLAAYLVRRPFFLTNDDSGIQDALSGSFTGTPYPYHQFINVLMGYFETSLFRALPSVPWWFVTEMVYCVLGAGLFNYAMLLVSRNAAFNQSINQSINQWCLSILLILLFDFLYFFYNILTPSFTLSPAMLGAGAVCLFFTADAPSLGAPRVSGLRPWLIGLCVVPCFLMRQASGLVVFCFYCAGVFFWCTMRTGGKWMRSLGLSCLYAVPIFMLLAAGGLYSSHRTRLVNGTEFEKFNTARVRYTDYHHVSYDENPEVFERFGMTRRKVYNGGWSFMDSSVTADFFNAVADASPIFSKDEALQNKQAALNPPSSFFALPPNFNVTDSTSRLYDVPLEPEPSGSAPDMSFMGRLRRLTFKKAVTYPFRLANRMILNPLAHNVNPFIFWAVVMSLVPLCIFFRRKSLKDACFITSCLVTAGSWLLVAYLVVKGRPIERALLCIFIPQFCMSAVMLCSSVPRLPKWAGRTALVAVALLCLLFSVSASRRTLDRNSSRRGGMSAVYPVLDFVREHPEDIFVYDISFSSVDCFVHRPMNLPAWGGSTWKSDLWRRQLAQLGLESLDMTSFRKENVFFLTVSERSARNLYSLLYESYGATGAVCTRYSAGDSGREFYVVKFRFEE